MRHFLCILCFVVLSMTAAQAQYYGSSNKKAIKAYQSGIDAMNHGDPGKAIAKYKEALKYDPDFVEMYLSIGEIFMKAKQYNEAIAAYEAFLKADRRHKEWQEGARENISLMRWRMDAVSNPVDFEPTNLGSAINSPNDEYLPALTVDGKTLIFTRRFPANEQTVHTAPFEEDFYISSLNGGSWSKAVRMDEPVNSHDNEGAQCISQDGRIMFFTACGRRDGEGRCDLYMCTRKGNKWSKPRNLGPDVNSPAWESQPSFAIDGRTVYFASNRKGGYGGNDIWKTTFTNGKWSRPENLGPLINTPGNEVSPFIHYNNHTLYFASDGHIGMGGADIFKAEMDENGQWQKPVNLGYPINTERDESGLIVAADGKTAYFSSEREGGYGKQDIYQFELPQEAQTEAVAYQTGVVFNKKTGQKLSATISIINVETGEAVAGITSDGTNGSFTVTLPAGVTYAMHVTAKGYLFYSANFNLKHASKDIALEPLQVPLSPIEIGEQITLRNIFFETAQYELLPASEVELKTLLDILEKNPQIKVEIAGHTDNVGKAETNQTLSLQRAQSVYDWLIENGIDESRLSYQGYGDSKPIATNDTEQGRALNRRTTMTIIGE